MGLFNSYLKEGKGVSKDEREKKGFFKFWEHFSHNSWKLFMTSLVANLISLFIFTGGIAEVGMAKIARSVALDIPIFPVSDFFETVKKNWKQALAVGIIDLIVFAFMGCSVFIAFAIAKVYVFGTPLVAILIVGFLLFWLSSFYHYSLIITCDMKLKEIYINSLKLMVLGIKSSLIIAFSLAFIGAILFGIISLGNALANAVAVLIFTLGFRMLTSYIIQFNTFTVIKKYILIPYYKENPEKDLELQQEFGIK